MSFSSDLVFDGGAGPYSESDPASPGCVYGRSKAEAERLVLEAAPDTLMIRTSAFFGPWDRYNFAWHVLSTLARGETVEACSRTRVSPTFVPDLCHAALDLLIDGESGLWHLANQGELSWHEFACRLAEGAGYDRGSIVRADSAADTTTALTSERGLLLQPIERAIDCWLADVADDLKPPASIAAE